MSPGIQAASAHKHGQKSRAASLAPKNIAYFIAKVEVKQVS